MLELAFVRNNLDLVAEKLAQRGSRLSAGAVRDVDQRRRSLLTEVETLKTAATGPVTRSRG